MTSSAVYAVAYPNAPSRTSQATTSRRPTSGTTSAMPTSGNTNSATRWSRNHRSAESVVSERGWKRAGDGQHQGWQRCQPDECRRTPVHVSTVAAAPIGTGRRISISTVDGAVYETGDSEVEFTI